jgi:hypothetical protein
MTVFVRLLLPVLLLVPAVAQAQEAAPVAAPPVAPTSAPSPEGDRILKDHQQQLLTFQQRLDQLASKLTIAEGKLDGLKQTVLAGVSSGTRAVVIHQNDMAENFVLERAEYLLDGGVLLDKENTDGSLDRIKRFEIFNGALPPGQHEINVNLVFRGSSFGSYTYLAGYKFKVESRYVMTCVDGRLNQLTIVTHEKADATAETKDRMAVRYDLEVGPDPTAAPKAATPETKP